MALVEPLLTLTLPVRHSTKSKWYLPLPMDIRRKFHIQNGYLIEIGILQVVSGVPKKEQKEE